MKYFKKYKTKTELMGAIKRAVENEKFFDVPTMRFFGKQKMSIEVWEDIPELIFKIQFIGEFKRVAYYKIDPKTLKLNSFAPEEK